MIIEHKEDYAPLRYKEYPGIGEQLDAIYKGFVALKELGIELPKETVEWLETIDNIKSTFKKD